MSPRRAVTRRIRGLEDLRPLQRIELGIGPKRQCHVENDRLDQRHECNVARWFPGESEEPTQRCESLDAPRCHVVASAFRSEQERLDAWQRVRYEYVAHWEEQGRLRPPWGERVLSPLLFDCGDEPLDSLSGLTQPLDRRTGASRVPAVNRRFPDLG
jgi:hypothetical protein